MRGALAAPAGQIWKPIDKRPTASRSRGHFWTRNRGRDWKRFDKRPAFDALCKDAARRKFDMVAAWSVDRLSRSLHDLTGFLKDLHALNIDLYLHQQGLDTSTPTGKAMFQMVGVFAELERALIKQRVKAGLDRARAQGKILGRRPIDRAIETKIQRALKRGDRGIRKIARDIGAGVGTVQRIKDAMAEA